MKSQETRTSASMPLPLVNETAEKLAQKYLGLTERERQSMFADTSVVAVKYEIPQRTLQHWISDGLVAAVKVGKKYKVYVPSLAAYVQDCARRQEVI